MSTKPKRCFNCGESTSSTANRVQPPALARSICAAAACWKAWWSLLDATPPTKKGRRA